jgi:hypothetical protein
MEKPKIPPELPTDPNPEIKPVPKNPEVPPQPPELPAEKPATPEKRPPDIPKKEEKK